MTKRTNGRASISLGRALFWPLSPLLLALEVPVFAGQTSGGGAPLTCQAPVLVVPATSVSGPAKPAAERPITSAGGGAGSTAVPASDSGRIETDPTQFDLRFADAVTMSIRNTTPNDISQLRFNSLGLTDGNSHHSIPSWDWNLTMTTALKPGERMDCTFHPPTSVYAGTYVGTLRIQANGHETTVPMTVRTRGPLSSHWSGFPLTLLTLTFLAGWLLSLLLNQWYTNDLPRVQQVLLLRGEQKALSNLLERLQAWQDRNHVALTTMRAVVKFDSDDVDTLLKRGNGASLVELQQGEQRFQLACSLNDELWTALQIAELTLSGQNLSSVATRLDSVPRSSDPSAYRAALLQVLTAPPSAIQASAATPPAAAAAISPNLSTASSAVLHEEMRVMDAARALIVAFVAWGTAYVAYYRPNPSFGTGMDYIVLFTWALGLTTTGSQLIAGIRKP